MVVAKRSLISHMHLARNHLVQLVPYYLFRILWVLDVRDGNDDDEGKLVGFNLVPKLSKRIKMTIS